MINLINATFTGFSDPPEKIEIVNIRFEYDKDGTINVFYDDLLVMYFRRDGSIERMILFPHDIKILMQKGIKISGNMIAFY